MNKPVIDNISALVTTRSVLQEQRIAFGNRLDAIARGDMSATDTHIRMYREWQERFAILEKYAEADIKLASESVSIVERMVAIKGIGRVFAAQLVSYVDIYKAHTISALWRYCGYGVEDGRAERRTKGQRLHYNPKVKTLCWNIGSSFLRSSSPYRAVYDQAKERYETLRPDWTKARIHNASQRIMVKRFLAHLWLVWRKEENLPIRAPYVQEYKGHTSIDTPEQYGW